MTKLYLAGPMTGIEHYNFPAFHKEADFLRAYGHEVFSPAENDIANGFDATGLKGHEAAEHGFSLREALKQDLSWICDHAEGIALLPGWENSKGVAAEVALGKALGIPVENAVKFYHNLYNEDGSVDVPEEAVVFEPGLGFVVEEVA